MVQRRLRLMDTVRRKVSERFLGFADTSSRQGRGSRWILRLLRQIETTETSSLCCVKGVGIRSFLETKGIFRVPYKTSCWKPKAHADSRRCAAIRSSNIPRISGNSTSGCAGALRRRSVNSPNSSVCPGCGHGRTGACEPA